MYSMMTLGSDDLIINYTFADTDKCCEVAIDIMEACHHLFEYS